MLRFFVLLLLSSLVLAPNTCLADEGTVAFDIKLLAVDANEGIAATDVNGDGKLDLVAGRFWYQNPDWAPRPLRNIDDWNGYIQSNGDYIFDVNQDGLPDVVAGSFVPSEVHWYENPGKRGLRLGQLWTKSLLVDTGQQRNEGVLLEDLDDDGHPEWVANSWAKNVPMYVCRLLPKEACHVSQRGVCQAVKTEHIKPTCQSGRLPTQANPDRRQCQRTWLRHR